MSLFAHFAHLDEKIAYRSGDWVRVGDPLGRIGSSGNSTSAHLHFEILRFKPENPRRYVNGKTRAQVATEYVNPEPFIRKLRDGRTVPCEDDKTRRGYGWLEYIKNNGNGYYHSGLDLNSLYDHGSPLYSPVEGRIWSIEDVGWFKNWAGGWTKTDWNGGWGRHLWIEIDPSWLITSKIKFN